MVVTSTPAPWFLVKANHAAAIAGGVGDLPDDAIADDEKIKKEVPVIEERRMLGFHCSTVFLWNALSGPFPHPLIVSFFVRSRKLYARGRNVSVGIGVSCNLGNG